MANADLKNTESMQKAQATPHPLDMVSKSRPGDEIALDTLILPSSMSIPGSENSHDQNPVVKEFVRDPKSV